MRLLGPSSTTWCISTDLKTNFLPSLFWSAPYLHVEPYWSFLVVAVKELELIYIKLKVALWSCYYTEFRIIFGFEGSTSSWKIYVPLYIDLYLIFLMLCLLYFLCVRDYRLLCWIFPWWRLQWNLCPFIWGGIWLKWIELVKFGHL